MRRYWARAAAGRARAARPTAAGLAPPPRSRWPLRGYALWRSSAARSPSTAPPGQSPSSGTPSARSSTRRPSWSSIPRQAPPTPTAHGALSAEYVAYLGPPLLLLVAVPPSGTGVTCGCAPQASHGRCSRRCRSASHGPLPFHWLQSLPLVGDIISQPDVRPRGRAPPRRCSRSGSTWPGPGCRHGRAAAPGGARRGRAARAAAAGTAPGGGRARRRVPAGWDTVFTRLRLPPRASVLVVPLPYSQQGEAMLWQADTGQPASWSRAGSSAPARPATASPPMGAAVHAQTVHCLDALWQGAAWTRLRQPRARAAVLAPGRGGRGHRPGTPLGRFLIGLLGAPDTGDGQCSAGGPLSAGDPQGEGRSARGHWATQHGRRGQVKVVGPRVGGWGLSGLGVGARGGRAVGERGAAQQRARAVAAVAVPVVEAVRMRKTVPIPHWRAQASGPSG